MTTEGKLKTDVVVAVLNVTVVFSPVLNDAAVLDPTITDGNLSTCVSSVRTPLSTSSHESPSVK